MDKQYGHLLLDLGKNKGKGMCVCACMPVYACMRACVRVCMCVSQVVLGDGACNKKRNAG